MRLSHILVVCRYTGSLQTERERFTEHTFQADWLRPLGKGHQLEIGTKYIDRNNNSHNTQEFFGDDLHAL